jgi:hypothetical protein
LKSFIYRYGFISILSFLISNLLYNIFILKFHVSFASFLSLFIVLNLNIFFFFLLKIFKINKKNYFRIVLISTFFRISEYLLFNLFHLYLFREILSSIMFALTLILSFMIKSIVFYKSSDIK